MSGFFYLVRIGDLYRIGSGKNLDASLKKLKADEVITTVETDDAKGLEARLLRRYKDKRIPDTNYLRLSQTEALECKSKFIIKKSIRLTSKEEVSITLSAVLLLFILVLISLIFIRIDLSKSLAFSFLIGSIPLWIFLVLGNLGGYDSVDLPFFSTWANRIKSMFIGSLMMLLFYFFYNI